MISIGMWGVVSTNLRGLKRIPANSILILATSPDEAAESLASFIEGFDLSKTGQYWAPRGPRYVLYQ